jgi:hypothetical protein
MSEEPLHTVLVSMRTQSTNNEDRNLYLQSPNPKTVNRKFQTLLLGGRDTESESQTFYTKNHDL